MPSGRRSRRGSAPGGLSGGESVGKGQETGPHLDAVEEGSDDEKTVFIGDKAVEDLLRSSSLSLHNVSRELTRTTLQREAVTELLDETSDVLEARKLLSQLMAMTVTSEGPASSTLVDAKVQEKIKLLERKVTKLEGEAIRASRFEEEVQRLRRESRKAENKRIEERAQEAQRIRELEESLENLRENNDDADCKILSDTHDFLVEDEVVVGSAEEAADTAVERNETKEKQDSDLLTSVMRLIHEAWKEPLASPAKPASASEGMLRSDAAVESETAGPVIEEEKNDTMCLRSSDDLARVPHSVWSTIADGLRTFVVNEVKANDGQLTGASRLGELEEPMSPEPHPRTVGAQGEDDRREQEQMDRLSDDGNLQEALGELLRILGLANIAESSSLRAVENITSRVKLLLEEGERMREALDEQRQMAKTATTSMRQAELTATEKTEELTLLKETEELLRHEMADLKMEIMSLKKERDEATARVAELDAKLTDLKTEGSEAVLRERRASVASLCAETSRIREIEKKAREAERKAEESERSGKKVILTLREMDTMVNRMKEERDVLLSHIATLLGISGWASSRKLAARAAQAVTTSFNRASGSTTSVFSSHSMLSCPSEEKLSKNASALTVAPATISAAENPMITAKLTDLQQKVREILQKTEAAAEEGTVELYKLQIAEESGQAVVSASASMSERGSEASPSGSTSEADARAQESMSTLSPSGAPEEGRPKAMTARSSGMTGVWEAKKQEVQLKLIEIDESLFSYNQLLQTTVEEMEKLSRENDRLRQKASLAETRRREMERKLDATEKENEVLELENTVAVEQLVRLQLQGKVQVPSSLKRERSSLHSPENGHDAVLANRGVAKAHNGIGSPSSPAAAGRGGRGGNVGGSGRSAVEELVQAMVDKFSANEVELPIQSLGENVYRLGSRKIHLAVISGRLVVRTGGGYSDFLDYLERVKF